MWYRIEEARTGGYGVWKTVSTRSYPTADEAIATLREMLGRIPLARRGEARFQVLKGLLFPALKVDWEDENWIEN